MLGNASGTVSPPRRRHKRRRRSRTDEKRPTKKKERVEKTATCSETSQATRFTQGSLSVEKESDENRPPLVNVDQDEPLQETPPLTCERSSLSFSTRQSNTEGMLMKLAAVQRDERVRGSMVHENLSVGDSLSVDSAVGEASDHHEGTEISSFPQTTFVSDAWSTDQHRASWDGMQEVESTPPEKLCEELRRSLSLFSQTEDEDRAQLYAVDKNHLSDNIDDAASLSVRRIPLKNARCLLLRMMDWMRLLMRNGIWMGNMFLLRILLD